MSNYNDRIINILNLLEREIELLRHTINIHNLQNEIRRMTDLIYRHRRIYSYDSYPDYNNIRNETRTNTYRDILDRRNNLYSRNYDYSTNYGNLNQTNTRNVNQNEQFDLNRNNPLNQTNIQNQTDTRNINQNEQFDLNRNTPLNQSNIQNQTNTNQNTDNVNQNNTRNTFARLFQNIVPDLVEVSFVDANGRNISNPRNVLNNLINPNISLENLRTTSTIEVYEGEPEMCTICRSEMENGDVVRIINSCRHLFHINCIDRWLEGHTRCPTCRCNLLQENDQNTEGEEEV
jgi:hypothetical protein